MERCRKEAQTEKSMYVRRNKEHPERIIGKTRNQITRPYCARTYTAHDRLFIRVERALQTGSRNAEIRPELNVVRTLRGLGQSTSHDERKRARTATTTQEISLLIPTNNPYGSQGPTTSEGEIDNARTNREKNQPSRKQMKLTPQEQQQNQKQMIQKKPPQMQKSKETPKKQQQKQQETRKQKNQGSPTKMKYLQSPSRATKTRKITAHGGESQPRTPTKTNGPKLMRESRQQHVATVLENTHHEQAKSRGKIQEQKQHEEEIPPRIITTPPAEEGNVDQDWDKQRKRQKANTWKTREKSTKE